MIIKIDLYKDWVDKIIAEIENLKKNGFYFGDYRSWEKLKLKAINNQINEISKQGGDLTKLNNQKTKIALKKSYNNNLLHVYLDFSYRLISQQKRTVIFSKEFQCPVELKEGLDNLVYKIENGISLFPHLSRKIFNATQQDGMLFDWGIQHLHLGIEAEKNNPRMVKGHKHIVYCIVKDKIIYLIQIEHHGKWANKEILRIVNKNWPELLEPFKMSWISRLEKNITEREHIELRRAGVNTITELDGDYFFSPGGGINTAKGSSQSTSSLQNIIFRLEAAEKLIVDYAQNKICSIESEIGRSISEIDFKMAYIDNHQLIVNDIKNNLQVILNINEETNKFVSILFQKIIEFPCGK